MLPHRQRQGERLRLAAGRQGADAPARQSNTSRLRTDDRSAPPPAQGAADALLTLLEAVKESRLDPTKLRVQLAQVYFDEGTQRFRVRAVDGRNRQGLHNELLPAAPDGLHPSPDGDAFVDGFERLVEDVPRLLDLMRMVTLKDVLESHRNTNMCYELFGCRVAKALRHNTLQLLTLGFIYAGISAREADIDALVSMILRLVEEAQDPLISAADVIDVWQKLDREKFDELEAALKPADDSEEALERARRAVAQLSKGGKARSLRCAAETFGAHKAGASFALLQAVLPLRILNQLCGVRRSLREHETMTLILGINMTVLITKPHVVVNTLNQIADIPNPALREFLSVAARAWQVLRSPDDGGQPLVQGDVVLRAVFKMCAEHLEASDSAAFDAIAARACDMLVAAPRSDSYSGRPLKDMVRHEAHKVLLEAAQRAPPEDQQSLRAAAEGAAAEVAEAAEAEAEAAEGEVEGEGVEEAEGEGAEEAEAEGECSELSWFGPYPTHFIGASRQARLDGTPLPGMWRGAKSRVLLAEAGLRYCYPEGDALDAALLEMLRDGQRLSGWREECLPAHSNSFHLCREWRAESDDMAARMRWWFDSLRDPATRWNFYSKVFCRHRPSSG